MWVLDHKKSQRIDALELGCWRRLLRFSWTARRSNHQNPKGNQSWIFIGKTDAEAEAPVLWPPDRKNWLIGKDPDPGKGWRWEEKGMTEDEMVGWHHWLDGYEFQQALGVGNGHRSLACCSPWGCKESDMTEWLNWSFYSMKLYHQSSYKDIPKDNCICLSPVWLLFQSVSTGSSIDKIRRTETSASTSEGEVNILHRVRRQQIYQCSVDTEHFFPLATWRDHLCAPRGWNGKMSSGWLHVLIPKEDPAICVIHVDITK